MTQCPMPRDDFNVGAGHRTGLPGNAISQATQQVSLLASDFAGKVGCEDVKSEQSVNQRSWDRALGPSARSVCRASNNEATTVAAIRGALPPDNPISHQNEKTKEYKSDCRSTTGKETGRGAFWMLWSHATECVRSGDLNRAYMEILGSGDELLLMWMMSCTGPVLHQLNPATVLQLMQCYTHAPTASLPRDCDPLDSAGTLFNHGKLSVNSTEKI